MDKAYLERLDKSELSRVRAILDESAKKGSLDTRELFRNKVPSEIISKGKQPHLADFDGDLLPYITLFGKTTLLEICPHCECVSKPGLLEPFLERGVVLPALSTRYARFPPQFIESLLSFPHLSAPEFLGFRNTFFKKLSKDHVERGFVCEHCVNKRQKEGEIFISKSGAPDKVKYRLMTGFREFTVPALQPYMYPDYLLLDEAVKSLSEKDFRKFLQIERMIGCVNVLRTSQAYRVTPHVNIENLESLETMLAQHPKIKMKYEIAEAIDFVLKGLKLSFSPSIPVETYLDIVEPRKQKISGLVEMILERAKPQSEAYLSNLQKEVDRINDEVKSLQSSKKTKLLNLCTNFVTQNKGLVASCIAAAGIGLTGAGLAACGVAGAGLVSKAVGRYVNISFPKEAEDFKQELMNLLEPGYEELLAHYLSKDLEIIQVWRLQSILKRTESSK